MRGVSLGVRLVRAIGVAFGLAVSAITVIGVPLGVLVWVWEAFYEFMGGRLPYVTHLLPKAVPDAVVFSPLFDWEGTAISAPPSWSWVVEQSLTLPFYLAVFVMILHLGIPMRKRLQNATGLQVSPVDPTSEVQYVANQLQKISKGPAARVWVMPGNGIQALALSGPLRGHAIVLSEAVAQSQNRPIVHWIIAHEYAHILHGDTRSSSLWILGMRSVHLFDRWRVGLMNLILRTVGRIPFIRVLTFPLYLLFLTINKVGRLGRWTGSTIFLLFDRWSSRRMEFAADKYAAQVVGVGQGVALFKILTSSFEPGFGGLFATHPKLSARIEKLESLQAPITLDKKSDRKPRPSTDTVKASGPKKTEETGTREAPSVPAKKDTHESVAAQD